MPKTKPVLTVYVRGGCIAGVTCNAPKLLPITAVQVVDYDIGDKISCDSVTVDGEKGYSSVWAEPIEKAQIKVKYAR